MSHIFFDYFHGENADQYQFVRVPKVLFQDPDLRHLSSDAKLLYGLLLDRMGLSLKNNWIDEQNRVYIIYTIEDICEALGCSRGKGVKSLKELDTVDGIGLVEKDRLGRGFATRLYVKNFMAKFETEDSDMLSPSDDDLSPKEPSNPHNSSEVQILEFKKSKNENSRSTNFELQEFQNMNFKNSEIYTSRSSNIRIPEVQILDSNNTNINNTEYSNTEKSNTEQSNQSIYQAPAAKTEMTIDGLRESIKDQISYDDLMKDVKCSHYMNTLVEIMVDVMLTPDNSMIRVSSSSRPASVVKEQFRKLRRYHIEYVIDSLEASAKTISSIRHYLITALYNAVITFDVSRIGRQSDTHNDPVHNMIAHNYDYDELERLSIERGLFGAV